MSFQMPKEEKKRKEKRKKGGRILVFPETYLWTHGEKEIHAVCEFNREFFVCLVAQIIWTNDNVSQLGLRAWLMTMLLNM